MPEYKFDWSKAETEEGLREELARFRARNGIVLTEPNYEDHRWTEENLRKYREEPRKNDGPVKLFYLAETGNISRNAHLISLVVSLKNGHRLNPAELDRLLEVTPPLLRVDVMEETKPAGEFRKRTFDLVETAIECGAKEVLRQLLPHIEPERYDRKKIEDVLA